MISTSRQRTNSSGVALAAKPAGSKNPTGGRSPIRPVSLGTSLKVMFFFLGGVTASVDFFTARVAEREVEDLATWTGAKAAAPAKRVERTASFILEFGVWIRTN